MAVRAETFAEGVPCWADAMLSDVEAGKRFYGELFGWTFGEGEQAAERLHDGLCWTAGTRPGCSPSQTAGCPPCGTSISPPRTPQPPSHASAGRAATF